MSERICRKDGHGKHERDVCPKCCIHDAQIELSNGPICSACGRSIDWIRAVQLQAAEAQVLALTQERDEWKAAASGRTQSCVCGGEAKIAELRAKLEAAANAQVEMAIQDLRAADAAQQGSEGAKG